VTYWLAGAGIAVAFYLGVTIGWVLAARAVNRRSGR
jgi:hypothetical protein